MRIPIDRHHPTPLYQQIETYLRQNILSGTLLPQTRLPAARQIAQALGVSRITIENAYAALESNGLVERREGSGTYVLPPDMLPQADYNGRSDWPLWQYDVIEAAGLVQKNGPNVAPSPHPAPISFTGFGDPRRFPVDDFYNAIKEVMRRDGIAALEFDDARGYGLLRATVAHVLTSQGVQAHPDNVLITSGSQQALALIAQILLKPGDVVLVEAPTYDRALDLFRSHRLKLVGCPTDAGGCRLSIWNHCCNSIILV